MLRTLQNLAPIIIGSPLGLSYLSWLIRKGSALSRKTELSDGSPLQSASAILAALLIGSGLVWICLSIIASLSGRFREANYQNSTYIWENSTLGLVLLGPGALDSSMVLLQTLVKSSDG